MFKNRGFVLGLCISLLFIGLFYFSVDVVEMQTALIQADYRFLAPGIGLYFVSVGFRAIRWQYILAPLRRIPLSQLYSVVVVGYMANNLLPMRLGEVVRAYYLSKKTSINISSGLATIGLERIYDGLVLVAFAATSLLILRASDATEGVGAVTVWTLTAMAAVSAAIFLGMIVFFTLITVRPSLALVAYKLIDYLPGKVRQKIKDSIAQFIDGLQRLKSPKTQLKLLILSLPVWILEGGVYLMLAYSFDIPGSFVPHLLIIPVILMVTAASNLATAVPASPGAVGPFEFFAKESLLLVGIQSGIAGAYAILLHVTLLLPVTLVGLWILWVGPGSFSNLTKMAKDKISSSSGNGSIGIRGRAE